MFRLTMVIIFGGAILGYNGYQEFTVSRTASLPGAHVDLAQIEASPELENNYVRLDGHWAIYPGAIFEYQTDRYGSAEPADDDQVTQTYYPIVSYEHPFLTELEALSEQYGDADQIPEAEWPRFDQFAMLVKTKRFKTIGSIPDDWEEEVSLEGLVINRIETLDAEEQRLIRESFPAIDLDQVLIVEEGRLPSSLGKSFGMMSGGGALLLAAAFLLFRGFKK